MKYLKLISFVIATTSVSVSAKSNTIYADVQVTDIAPTSHFIWERVNENPPKYPIELARSGLRGCAVLSFDISDSGSTENIQVINSLPKKQLGIHSRKMLKKWKWVPVSPTTDTNEEKKNFKVRFLHRW